MSARSEQKVEAEKYPVGRFKQPKELSGTERAAAIEVLLGLPAEFRKALAGLTEAQLDTPYREGGWTLRQLAHHLADSHSQANGRFKLALTEDWPTVKPYDQTAWAELEDARTAPVAASLGILEGVHARFAVLLPRVAEADWNKRGYRHPENGDQTLGQVLAMYTWHSRHHLAHARNLRERMGW